MEDCKEVLWKTKNRTTISSFQFSLVQSLSRGWLFATPWTAARQASLSITNFQSLLKLMSIELVMPSHPLFPPSPPALNLSQHQSLFKWVSSLHQVAKVLKLQLQHQSLQWTLRTDLLYYPFLNLVFSVVKNLEPCYLKCCLLLKFDKW